MSVEGLRTSARSALSRFRTATGLSPVATAIVGVTALSFLLRIVDLGGRIAHFDEGRVAYWSLEFLETGSFSYRYIIHGPFVQHVNRVVFELFGANDFTMRLVVALIGAALPAVVLLFRERLRDTELVAAAILLAVNPVLLYYSRFFRSTVLVAAFMTAALGVFVRALDTRRGAYLSLVGLLVGLGFASKENAVVYIACFLGAAALLVDYELMDPASHDRGTDLLRARGAGLRRAVTTAAGRDRTRYWLGHAGAGVVVFLLVTLFFFAPRSPDGGVGLWSTLTTPAQLPTLVDTTWADIERGMEYWFGRSADPKCGAESVIAGGVCFIRRTMERLVTYAAPLLVFALLGLLIERYATDRPRALVMAASYWGVASLIGYPFATDIFNMWITVNALVPLAIPAGVGAATIARWGYEALPDRRTDAVLAAVVLLVAGAQIASVAATAVYLHPAGQTVGEGAGGQLENTNGLVQYAQPAGDFRPVVRDLRAIAPANEGTDVLFYGDKFVVDGPGQGGGLVPECTVFVRTLPLHWYLRAADANATCAFNQSDLDRKLADAPPVVVAPAGLPAQQVESQLDGYERSEYLLRSNGRRTVFFVDRSALNGTDARSVSAPSGDRRPASSGGRRLTLPADRRVTSSVDYRITSPIDRQVTSSVGHR